jgi:hypothetical protein
MGLRVTVNLFVFINPSRANSKLSELLTWLGLHSVHIVLLIDHCLSLKGIQTYKSKNSAKLMENTLKNVQASSELSSRNF